MKDWKNAAYWANEVMTKGNRNLLNNYADVFKAENNYSSNISGQYQVHQNSML